MYRMENAASKNDDDVEMTWSSPFFFLTSFSSQDICHI
jgi:hypothetical protein